MSQAPIDSIVAVHESGGKVESVSVCSIEIDEKIKRKLQRFLDATRGELFFARRLLMVEGIAEVLLLPVLTKIAGGCLKESAVTVLNADGLNFNAFLPLFGKERLGIPIAIMTDGDALKIGEQPSAMATSLKHMEERIVNLRVEFSAITFEHELARSSNILPLMLEAFESLHPTKGRELKETIAGIDSGDEKANHFLGMFLQTKTSKGSFAQELAALLEASDIPPESIPRYIIKLLEYLGVTNPEVNHE